MKKLAIALFVYFCMIVQLHAEECEVHHHKELGIEYPATEFNLFDEFLLDLSKLPQLDPPVKNLSSNPVYRAYIAPSDSTIMIVLTEDRVTFFKLCSSREECNGFARVYYIDSLIVEEFRRLQSAGVLPGTATEADSMIRHAIQMIKSDMPSVDNISLSGCVYNLYKPTGDSDKGGRVMSTAGLCVYEDKDGITKVNVTFTDEDIWLTQSQLAEIYKTSRENVTMHISNIYKDNELPKDSTCKKFLQVQNEGSRSVKRNIDHYNLDMIIALGYRVQSEVAIRFRIWATQRLHEYIQKGFTMDDERLKQTTLCST